MNPIHQKQIIGVIRHLEIIAKEYTNATNEDEKFRANLNAEIYIEELECPEKMRIYFRARYFSKKVGMRRTHDI